MKNIFDGIVTLGMLLLIQMPVKVSAEQINNNKIAVDTQKSRVQFGGVAGMGFTLLGVEHKKLDKIDRIILDIGNYRGEPNQGWPNYYHSELNPQTKKLVIDLSQTPNSMVSDETLKRVFQKVDIVQGSKVVADPTEPNLTLIIDLKKNVQMKAYQVQGKKTTSKIVIDLMSL